MPQPFTHFPPHYTLN